MKKPKPPGGFKGLHLLIVDRGDNRQGLPLRDVYLRDWDGGVGQSTLLDQCNVSAGFAENLAAWFTSVGVKVIREGSTA